MGQKERQGVCCYRTTHLTWGMEKMNGLMLFKCAQIESQDTLKNISDFALYIFDVLNKLNCLTCDWELRTLIELLFTRRSLVLKSVNEQVDKRKVWGI